MKNLKKVLAVLISTFMLFSLLVPALAADEFAYEPESEILRDLGLFYGIDPEKWVPDLGSSLTREQGIAMIIRLLGFEDESQAMTQAEVNAALAQYEDKGEIAVWAKNYVAFAVQEGLVVGMSETQMGPKIQLLGKMFATIILQNLGEEMNPEKYETACTLLQDRGGLSEAQATLFNDKPLIRDDFVGMSYGSLLATFDDGKTMAAGLIGKGIFDMATLETVDPTIAAEIGEVVEPTPTDEPTITLDPSRPLEYSALTATGAGTLTVEFNQGVPEAIAETLTITVTRTGSDVSSLFTTTWSTDRMKANLEKGSRMATGDYSVAIMYGEEDLGTKSVIIQPEKVTEITFPQETFIRYNDRDGEVKYHVFNQYSEDITSRAISTLTFYCSNGTVTKKTNGLLKIATDNSIYQNGTSGGTWPLIPTLTVTAMDSDSGVSVTKAFKIAEQVGAVASFEWTGVKSSTGSGDVQVGRNEDYILEYEATDIDGMPVESYMLFSNSNVFSITVSDSTLAEVTVETDPLDSNKAMFRLTLLKQTLSYDQPVTIYGLFSNIGVSSSLGVTIKRNASVSVLNLLAPAIDLVAGEKTEIMFEAYDQDNKKITKWVDIIGSTGSDSYVTLSGVEAENQNGELKLYVDTTNNTSGEILNISALVKKTGKISQFTATLQPKAYPYKIASVDYNKFKSVSPNSSCLVDASSFTVYDQYDRPYDMMYKTNVITNLDTNNDGTAGGTGDVDAYFYIEASISSGATKLTLNTDTAYGESNKIMYTGKSGSTAYGNATLKFQLKVDESSVGGTNITTLLPTDQKNVTISNFDTDNISAIMMETVPTLFANYAPTSDAKFNVIGTDLNSTTITGVSDVYATQWEAWAKSVKVYGVVGGVKVEIDQTNVTYSYDTSKFAVVEDLTSSPEFIRVVAYSLPTTDIETTGTLTATAVIGTNTFSSTVDLTAQKQSPSAQSIDVIAKSTLTPLGTVYEISAADVASNVIGKGLSYYNPNTGVGGYYNQSGIADIYFKINDQYGSTGLVPDNIIVTNATGNTGTVEVSSTTNIISLTTGSAALAAGDSFDITVTSGGVTKTITIRVT